MFKWLILETVIWQKTCPGLIIDKMEFMFKVPGPLKNRHNLARTGLRNGRDYVPNAGL